MTNREQEHLMPPHKDAELGCDVFTAVPPAFGLHTQIKIVHKDCQESQSALVSTGRHFSLNTNSMGIS